MENRAFGALAALLLCCMHAAPAASEPLRILYAEPFQAQTTRALGAQKPGPANLRVQAFGRTFELQLEDNIRLLRAASAQTRERIDATQLLKGTIKDAPGSWVRLTVSGGRYSGAFWDGTELYAIAPRETLDTALLAPMQPAVTAIYRLSDTQGGLLQGTCGVAAGERAGSSPLAKFKALIDELRAAADSAFSAAPREIEVALVADFELTSRLGSATAHNLLEKANIVDGIFSSQLAVSTIPTDFVSFATDTDPFDSAEAFALLEQLGTYRSNTPVLRSRGLTHLVTGRQLSGSTIGIAFLGSLCEAEAGVSLSESSGFIDSALIMAHELGHNFGAPHDAEPGSSCATTPLGFLMSPTFNNSTTFSACSVQRMQPHITAAACVVPSRNRDVAVGVPPERIPTFPNQQFEVPIDLLSVGDTAAANIILTVNMSFGVNVLSASMPGADCTSEPQFQSIHCELASLAPGASARLTLRATYPSKSEVTFNAHVLSSNDVNSNNDQGFARIVVVGERDMEVTAVAVPTSVTLGDAFDVEFDVAAVGNQTLSVVQADVFMSRAHLVSSSIDGGSCETLPDTETLIRCTISSLVPGTPRRLRARLISDSINADGVTVHAYEPSDITGTSTSVAIRTRPAHDIEVWTDQEDKVVALGLDAIWPIEVRSTGAYPMNDVHVQANIWIGADASLEGPLAALCTRISNDTLDCDLGTLAAGAVVSGKLRARSDVPANLSFSLGVGPGHSDDDFTNDFIGLDLGVRQPTDVVLTAPSTQSLFDQQPATLRSTVEGFGANASLDVRVDVSLPAGFSISSAAMASAVCNVLTPNRATCFRSVLSPGDSAQLTIQYQADAPGVYTGSIVVTPREDTDISNNTRTITFQVAPGVNGSLQAPQSAVLTAGIANDVVYTVLTNKYALTDARLDFTWSGNLDQFVASAPGVRCAATANGHSCTLGTLAANSSIRVLVRLRSLTATAVSINALLASPAETLPEDNSASVSYTFAPSGDLAVNTSQPAVDATTNQRVQVLFDENVLATVLDGFLEIGFDRARVQAPTTLSAGQCTWATQPVRCQLGASLSPGTYAENFSFVPTSAGPLQITLRVGARNDFNAANDKLIVTVFVADPAAPPAPPPPPPPSSGNGGGGGGGSMSWMFAALLVLMWHHRRTRSHR
jgi:hypothetical protein